MVELQYLPPQNHKNYFIYKMKLLSLSNTKPKQIVTANKNNYNHIVIVTLMTRYNNIKIKKQASYSR